VPSGSELWNLPFLNLKKSNEGKVIFLGEDEQGDKIYALSVKGDRKMIYRLVNSFLDMFKLPADELHLVDSCVRDNSFLLAGENLCRFDLLAPLGRLLVFAGIKKIYGRLSQLVNDQKARKVKLA